MHFGDLPVGIASFDVEVCCSHHGVLSWSWLSNMTTIETHTHTKGNKNEQQSNQKITIQVRYKEGRRENGKGKKKREEIWGK